MAKKLFIGKMSFDTTAEDLSAFLSAYGAVRDVVIIKDRESGRSRGFGFATFDDASTGEKAIAELDGKEFMGRQIAVSEAQERAHRSFGNEREFGSGHSSFRRKGY